MSYISRQAAIDHIKAQRERFFTGCTIEEGIEMLIREVPDADVVEVVRCKDCKYSELVNGGLLCGAWDAKAVDPEDYCSDGERK